MSKLPKNWTSTKGTGLGFTVTSANDREIKVVVQRKVTDKKTGEITIEERERTVPVDVWRYFVLAYKPT